MVRPYLGGEPGGLDRCEAVVRLAGALRRSRSGAGALPGA